MKLMPLFQHFQVATSLTWLTRDTPSALADRYAEYHTTLLSLHSGHMCAGMVHTALQYSTQSTTVYSTVDTHYRIHCSRYTLQDTVDTHHSPSLLTTEHTTYTTPSRIALAAQFHTANKLRQLATIHATLPTAA
ncbi:hypothetical protein BKA69DRAFT_609479 [Paraphysoderma sedebokerense]|nr:hypothetical protein BKA69DRAFT_609479 [Paraphysoderma sedebokerense]